MTNGSHLPQSSGASESFALVRLALAGLIVIAAVLISRDQFHTPAAAPASAPETEFSSARAMEHVQAVAVAPRPQGSQSAAAARTYVIAQLEALGLEAEVQDTTTVRTTVGTDAVFASRVVNVMARIPGTDSAGALVLSGHYDSGPNAPGAGDCGSCVATVLETARALLAGPPLRNDVILLFPDGEETQLFGAYAFVQQHPWVEDVAFALNLESQGVDGPAVFYVSSPNDENVADRVLEYAQQPVAHSFISTLVRNLVGGSDLDNFTDAEIPGAGIAFFESEQYYHTALDNPQRLNEGSVQHLGEYALNVVRGLGNEDLAALEGESDAIYFTLWRGTVLRYASAFALPLALVLALGTAGALLYGRRRADVSLGRTAIVLGISVATLFGALILVTLLWWLVRLTNPDYHVFLIGVTYDADAFVLAFSLLTVAIFLATVAWAPRGCGRFDAMAGSLVLWSLLALLTAVAAPTFSHLFAWPLFVGLGAFAFALWRPAWDEHAWIPLAAFGVVAVVTVQIITPAVLLLQTLGGRLEALSGIPAMALPVLWVALAVMLLLPFVPQLSPARSGPVAVALGIVSLVLVGWTTATSGFDDGHPKPNLAIYRLDTDAGTAEWLTTADSLMGRGRGGQLDEWTTQFLGDNPQPAEVAAWSFGPEMTTLGYSAPAPIADLPPPLVEVTNVGAEDGAREITLRVTSPRGAPNVRMRIGASATAVTVDGVATQMDGLETEDGFWLFYLALPPEGVDITLTTPNADALRVEVEDWSQGLPDLDGFTLEPRPSHMFASAHDLADTTMLRATYTIE